MPERTYTPQSSDDSEFSKMGFLFGIFALIGFVVSSLSGGGQSIGGPISKTSWYIYAFVGFVIVIMGIGLICSALTMRR